MKIQFNGPINNLSFGNVSLNLLRELVKRKVVHTFFPEKDQMDFSAFDRLDPDIKNKIISLAERRHSKFRADLPTLRLWHLNGSEFKVSDKQHLFTFYETDEPTIEEINLAANQESVIFSSSEACETFRKRGLDNVHFVPLGFDPDFFVDPNVPKLNDDIIHFGLIGKLEKRKNTQRIIQLWLKKYGNNPKYQLTCLVNNPFFKPEMYNEIINQTLGNQRWTNINFLPHLKTNSEVNHLLNAIDIDLSGISGAEGWGIPAFSATCLGKWSVVSNCTAHKDWATEDNCVLIETDGKKDCYDNVFFKRGLPFNQGRVYNITDESIIDGLERAEKKAKIKNLKGVELQKKFTYERSVKKILSIISR